MSNSIDPDAEDVSADDPRADGGTAPNDPQPEPAKTDHPTGEDQAAHNRETESPA